MPKSKAKTKRDPKSKPKNKSTFLGESSFKGEPLSSHELKRKRQRRENIFYTAIMTLIVAMFVGVPVASYLGGKNEPTDPQNAPAVSTTPNVNLETGVDGHLSDGVVDPSVVKENELNEYLNEKETSSNSEDAGDGSDSTTTKNEE